MGQTILDNYLDACALIKETEEDIRSLEKEGTQVCDTVKGSMQEWPYIEKRYHISGLAETEEEKSEKEQRLKMLLKKRENAVRIRQQAEELICLAPLRIQRIIRFKIMQKMTWEEVAAAMGERKSGDAYRKELKDFLKNN